MTPPWSWTGARETGVSPPGGLTPNGTQLATLVFFQLLVPTRFGKEVTVGGSFIEIGRIRLPELSAGILGPPPAGLLTLIFSPKQRLERAGFGCPARPAPAICMTFEFAAAGFR